jgi:Na+-transporting NADH:ubiquinone oxidoreductase subunit C
VEALFQQVETRKVDLRTGEFVDAGRSAEADEGTVLSGSEDIAGIRRRDDVKDVYLLERDGELQRLILPVRGMGLWAMMHGLIALGSDLNTIESLLFYEHGETPGLGGEVDNPRWRAQWAGKQAFDSQGNVRIEVIKGQVTPQTPDAEYKVDGLSGATFTARGVNNLVRFWLGEQGYGPLLDNMRKQVHP